MTLARLYRQMLLIRRFEERVYYLFLEGEIPGTLHQYQGQEAVAVGICDTLRPTDWITSTHRPHGHALAKGVSAARGDGRALRQEHRLLRRQGRLDAPRRSRLSGCCRRSPSSAAGTPSSPASGSPSRCARSDQVGGLLLRRRREQRGRVPRGDELRRRAAAADRLRLREQPLRRLDALQQPSRA